VDEVAGRYRSVRIGNAHRPEILLAKNPAGWQEALSMVGKCLSHWVLPSVSSSITRSAMASMCSVGTLLRPRAALTGSSRGVHNFRAGR
jgi:hypothetical protein